MAQIIPSPSITLIIISFTMEHHLLSQNDQFISTKEIPVLFPTQTLTAFSWPLFQSSSIITLAEITSLSNTNITPLCWYNKKQYRGPSDTIIMTQKYPCPVSSGTIDFVQVKPFRDPRITIFWCPSKTIAWPKNYYLTGPSNTISWPRNYYLPSVMPLS